MEFSLSISISELGNLWCIHKFLFLTSPFDARTMKWVTKTLFFSCFSFKYPLLLHSTITLFRMQTLVLSSRFAHVHDNWHIIQNEKVMLQQARVCVHGYKNVSNKHLFHNFRTLKLAITSRTFWAKKQVTHHVAGESTASSWHIGSGTGAHCNFSCNQGVCTGVHFLPSTSNLYCLCGC